MLTRALHIGKRAFYYVMFLSYSYKDYNPGTRLTSGKTYYYNPEWMGDYKWIYWNMWKFQSRETMGNCNEYGYIKIVVRESKETTYRGTRPKASYAQP